jgi:membrane associated rhomboid family serine protease
MLILSDDAESSSFPVVNWLLILFNVSCFLFALTLTTKSIFFNGVVPAQAIKDHDLTQFAVILTAMFCHLGFLHLLGNMWFLYLFGDNVEDKLGHFRYLAFYLICGVFAALLHIFVNAGSTMPCVGASGAIAGVMGAYTLLHPNATCKTWWGDDLIFFAFKTYRIPATLVIGGWFFMQLLLSYLVPISVSHIAFQAHIGGFVAGIILVYVLGRGSAVTASCLPAVAAQERRSTPDLYSNPRVFAMMGLGLAGALFTLWHAPKVTLSYSVALPAAQVSHPTKPKKVVQPAPHNAKTRTAHAHQHSKSSV